MSYTITPVSEIKNTSAKTRKVFTAIPKSPNQKGNIAEYEIYSKNGNIIGKFLDIFV